MRKITLILLFFIGFSCDSVTQISEESAPRAEQIFLELWEIFDENYAFFELRNIDWKAEREAFLTSNLTIENDSLLFEKLCALLKKFDDTHINLESDSLNLFCNGGKVPGFLTEFPTNESFGLFLEARNSTLQQVGVTNIADSQSKIFQFGLSENKKWGYLRIRRFYGASLEDIELELNKIHGKLRSVKNLIVDIRVNPGGNDETALLCSSYFFKQKEIAFIKTKREGKGYEDFGQPDTTYVYPNTKIQNESENIYLISNRAAGSSADAFALVMSYLPKVKIFGQNTEGIFSNMYRDTLSNGWRLTLSNERYFSKDMKCYEKIGVPVEVEIENKREDVLKGIDLVIKKIIEE